MLRCGICGDKTPVEQDHQCWVKGKLQEPAIHEICTRCGVPEDDGFRHWRCWDRNED